MNLPMIHKSRTKIQDGEELDDEKRYKYTLKCSNCFSTTVYWVLFGKPIKGLTFGCKNCGCDTTI